MLRRIIGLILICVGAWLLIRGWQRKDSLLGSISETGTKIANRFDGGARTPKHMMYMVGGGLIIACGAILTFSKSKG